MSMVVFDIDGYIGAGAYSKTYVKMMLKDAADKPVTANISSLGGDIDHGLAIHDQFIDHANVTARLSGFVASSATVVASGAKVVKMNSTAFFLVHKVSGWVDAWGYMNEDELQQLIDDLSQSKEENQKIDVVIAGIYAKRTGKPLNDIVDLMKKSTWLTADEAKEWGFIDEIIDMSASKDNLLTAAKVAMLEANGLPVPPRQKDKTNTSLDEESLIKKAIDASKAAVKSLFDNHKTKVTMSKNQFPALLACLGVESLEIDAEGGAHINADFFQKINDVLAQQDQLKAEKVAAETERQNVIDRLDAIHVDVKSADTVEAKIAAVIEKITKKAGSDSTRTDAGDSKGTADAADWDTINNLPHNREVDNQFV